MKLIEALKLVAGDGYAYCATPYSKYPGGMYAAYVDACKASAWCLKNGVRVFCPIAHSHPIAKYGEIDPVSHEIWLDADAPLMRAANGIIVVQMPTWRESYGVTHEIKVFAEANKPMCYLPWPLPEGDCRNRSQFDRVMAMTDLELSA